MSKMNKWLKAIVALEGGQETNCPKCESTNVKMGYIRVKGDMGCGGIWCEDCKQGLWLSRVHIDESNTSKILESLPTNIKFD